MFKKPAVMYVLVNYSLLIWSIWSTPPLAPVTDQNKPAVWAATRSGVNSFKTMNTLTFHLVSSLQTIRFSVL